MAKTCGLRCGLSIQKSRFFSKNGGILIFYKSTLNAVISVVKSKTINCFELVTLKIKFHQARPFFLTTVYRHPLYLNNETIDNFCEYLTEFCDFEHYLIGDFNIDATQTEMKY